ncbi:MAG TPA: hypothetical protein VMT76_13480 [Puia sp.]|nr:hypothetical protein [Puia sp.]
MKIFRIKNVFRFTFSVLLFLFIILALHVYLATRSRIDAFTRIMERIDIRQPVNQQDAEKITSWLYRQNGVDHVLCNAKTGIVVFTFSPLKANGNDILKKFAAYLNYPDATRFTPSEKELQESCPAASSFTYKVYNYLKHLF